MTELESFIKALFPHQTIFGDPAYSLQSFMDFLQDKQHNLFGFKATLGWRNWSVLEKLSQPGQEVSVASPVGC
jgi:hypothetical protein